MQGKALALLLASLNAQLDFTVVKKRFGKEERVDQGWVIWSYKPKYNGGSDAPYGALNTAPSDYYNMLEDGTTEKRVPQYASRLGSASPPREAFTVTEVIPADWYWSPSVVWQVYVHLWRYPNEPFRVRFESPKFPCTQNTRAPGSNKTTGATSLSVRISLSPPVNQQVMI